MVESCTGSQSKSILGPFPNKEPRSCNRRVSFDDNIVNSRNNSSVTYHEKCYASLGNREVILENHSFFQQYADRLFVSILESFTNNLMTNCILKSEKIDHFSNKIANDILEASFQEYYPAMRQNQKYQSIKKFAEEFVAEILHPIVRNLQTGLLEFSTDVAENIVSSAVAFAAHKLHIERIANLYAEKLSLRVFRDLFIHIITDANRIAYHLLGSYEAVSKNQLRTFAEHMIENIMEDLFPSEKVDEPYEPSLLDIFADDLSLDVVSSALQSYQR